MYKYNKVIKLAIILIICSIIEFILEIIVNTNLSVYSFGFPFPIVTIHELNSSFWYSFSHGMHINLAGIVFDLILYFIIYKIINRLKIRRNL